MKENQEIKKCVSLLLLLLKKKKKEKKKKKRKSNRLKQKSHEVRDQNKNHEPRRWTHEPSGKSKQQTHEPKQQNPQTQAQIEPVNVWFLKRRFCFPSVSLIFVSFVSLYFIYAEFLAKSSLLCSSSWQNQVSWTWDDSFLNSLKTLLTNEIIWKLVLVCNFPTRIWLFMLMCFIFLGS